MKQVTATRLDLSYVDDHFRNRFWSKVSRAGTDECWLWLATKNPNGYGKFMIRKYEFRVASRVALALVLGVVPAGARVCHRCDNPPCCNPAHLFLGSQSDNINDCVAKGRANRAIGVDAPTAKLTFEEVRAIRAAPAYYGMLADLSRQYGVTRNNIKAILDGTHWTHSLDDSVPIRRRFDRASFTPRNDARVAGAS